MFIDHKLISNSALDGLIRSYLHRSDFDSSDDLNEDTQVDQIIRALNRNELVITWSEHHQSFNIQSRESFAQQAYLNE